MNVRVLLLLSLYLCLSLMMSACGSRRGLTNEQSELVAWYIEDTVRGNVRSSDELILPAASPEMQRVATWLAGSKKNGIHIKPQQLTDRCQRWPALHTLFIEQKVVVLDSGLVAPALTIKRDQLHYVLPIVDQENDSRRKMDALIISLSDAGPSSTKAWLEQSAKARLTLDQAAGAIHWDKPIRSQSEQRIILTP